MNYFLIDFENVKTSEIKYLSNVKERDAFILFYSEQCKNISIEVMEAIAKLNLKFSSFKVKVGTKNALDFQLSSYLGYLIGMNKSEANYYIVSNDKGFDCLCDFWKEQNVDVKRIVFQEQISEAEHVEKKHEEKKSKIKTKDITTLEEINNLLAEEDEPEMVLTVFNKYKSKQAICNGLSKHYKDSKRTSAVYKKLKPLLKEKNKS